MVQRLLFDRIDTKPTAPTVGGQHHSIAHALTHETKSALPFVQLAKPRTQLALDTPIRQHHPPASRVIRLRQPSNHLYAISLRNQSLHAARKTQKGGIKGDEENKGRGEPSSLAQFSIEISTRFPGTGDSLEKSAFFVTVSRELRLAVLALSLFLRALSC